MTHRKDKVRLKHMREYSKEAIELAQGKTREDLDRDRVFELALTRLVEIIGEAAAKITPETQGKFAQIPWPEIIGLRNRLIHGYDAVDLDILWEIVQHDIPALLSELENIS